MPQLLNSPTYNDFIRPDAAAFGNQQINPFIQFVKQAAAHDDYIRSIQAKEAESRAALMKQLFDKDYAPAEVMGIAGAMPRVNPYKDIWDSFIGDNPTYSAPGAMPAESMVDPSFLNQIMIAAGIKPTAMSQRSLRLNKDLIKQGMVTKSSKDIATINANARKAAAALSGSNKGKGLSAGEAEVYNFITTVADTERVKGQKRGIDAEVMADAKKIAAQEGLDASGLARALIQARKDLYQKGTPDLTTIIDAINAQKAQDMGVDVTPYIVE